MKTPSDELFNIIKSLTRNEKTLFKVFCNQKSPNVNYLLLFDAIDSLKEFNEEKLQSIWNKKGGTNNLNDIKKYLKETIFRFLEYHYFDYSIDVQLQRYLQRIEILYDKWLLASAEKYVVRAEQLAVKHHQYPYLFSILQFKRKVFSGKMDVEKRSEIEEKKQYYSTLHDNINEFRKINNDVYSLFALQGQNPDKKSIVKLKKILEHPLLVDEKAAITSPAKFTYWCVLGDIYLLLKNWEKGYSCFKSAINYFDEALISPSERLSTYSRVLVLLKETKNDIEIIATKKSIDFYIQSLSKKDLTNNVYNRYLTLVNIYVDYQISQFNMKEALSIEEEIVQRIEKLDLQQYLVFYSNRTLIFFYSHDYRNALHSINRVFAKEPANIRQDIIYAVNFFNLLVHYELGNEDILPNLCKSYSLYLKQQKLQNKLDQVLLTFFSKTIQINTSKQKRINSFIELKKILESLKKENIFDQFDFLSWVESKIQNRPMIEILRKKRIVNSH